jgi:hypothetical protein
VTVLLSVTVFVTVDVTVVFATCDVTVTSLQALLTLEDCAR